MSNNEAIEEYKSGLSKWWIITGIVLFPLVPFALIYLNKKLNKYIRGTLIIIWFLVLCVIYQLACIKQGPVIKSISVPVSTISMKVGNTHKITYDVKPLSSQLKIDNVKYTSSNRSIATIDKKGNITSISPGKTSITITVQDNHYTQRTKKITLLVLK